MLTSNDLMPWVERQLDADDALDAEVGLLVLAALASDAELDDYLATGADPRTDPSDAEVGNHARATGAFLRSVTVSGFRGIGAPVTLDLRPGPGLTVVAGRNGSGKSSLAEALELLLTGGTYRWKNKRSTQWAEQWTNLHHDGAPEIRAVVVEEGAGPIRLRTTWETGTTDVEDHTTTAQRTVDGTLGPTVGVATLAWGPALETFRPMLSYDELGGLLAAGPSELYDALAKVLGTEQLSDALGRLKARIVALGAPYKSLPASRRALQVEAAGLVDDERAQAVAALLEKATPDVAAVRELATGVALPDQGVVASLRSLTHLDPPDPGRISAGASRLRSAVAGMAEAGEAEAARRVARLDLRRRALQLHGDHGEQTCPVCGTGWLDEAWVGASRQLVQREAGKLAELTDARTELESARASLRALPPKRPASLDRAPTPALEPTLSAARRTWAALETLPDGDLAVAEHLELYAEELAGAVARVRAEAGVALAGRDDAWGPLAGRIASWCETWDQWLEQKPRAERLTAAEKWLKDNDTRLKNERMAPISDAARHAWSVLRQDSNVDLGELRLEGQATRRRVAITATVDGKQAGGALPVMSQGELHALALALFLPRASLEESPFRFVVLDDPVQAMDPAKIDGLVALLTELAHTRQVVVFSHDDRLPAALRRTDTGAEILEVTRGLESAVTVTSAEDPTARYLRDARALTKDDGVPDATLRRTLPGLLRMAIETAARDRFYATRLTRGVPLVEVEQSWDDAHKTGQRVSLAIYDEVRSLDAWLKTESRRKGLGIASTAFHESLSPHTDPSDAVHHVERMVEDVRAGAK